MRYQTIHNDLFKRNRKKLSDRLEGKSIAILNANDEMPRNGDQYHRFRQNSDLFYLTGIEQEKSILLLAPGFPEKQYHEILFIRKSNRELETWEGHKLTAEEARKISGIKTILYLEDLDQIVQNLQAGCNTFYLNANEYPKFITDVESRDSRMTMYLKEKYPLHEYARLAPVLWDLRCIKESEELALIETACNITETAFLKVLNYLQAGMYEYEVEAQLNYEFTRRGSSGPAYAPIVASGKNACTLHYVSNDMKCKDGDLLLLDFGAEYANYSADCSRTIPVNGKFTSRQRECYEAVLRVFKKAKKLFVPGNTIRLVNKQVSKLIEDELIVLGLICKEDIENQDANHPLYMKYFMHGTSHFMGLDVHDPGDKDKPFEKGMVLTCEPGIYIKEEGIGIRIENDILVDEMPKDFMENIPLEIEEIENLMKRKY